MAIPAGVQRLHVSAESFSSGLSLDPATLHAGAVYVTVDDDLGIVMFVETAPGAAATAPPALLKVDTELLGSCDEYQRVRAEHPEDGVLGYCGAEVHKVVFREGSYEFFVGGEGVLEDPPRHDPGDDRSPYDFIPRPDDERPTARLEVVP